MTGAEPPPSASSSSGQISQDEPQPSRMLPKERQAGWLIVAVTVAGVAGSWAGDAAGGDGQALARLAIGLGLVVVLAGAVRYERRIVGAFASIVAGLAPLKTSFTYVAFAGMGYGAYLMFRASQAQRKAAASRPRPAPGQARQARADARAAKRKDGAGQPADAMRRPTANRRYTPPKPNRPRGR